MAHISDSGGNKPCRTTGWRIVAALLPAAVALSCVVIINAIVRTQPSAAGDILNLTALVPATTPP